MLLRVFSNSCVALSPVGWASWWIGNISNKIACMLAYCTTICDGHGENSMDQSCFRSSAWICRISFHQRSRKLWDPLCQITSLHALIGLKPDHSPHSFSWKTLLDVYSVPDTARNNADWWEHFVTMLFVCSCHIHTGETSCFVNPECVIVMKKTIWFIRSG
jgi:hypothetical protein